MGMPLVQAAERLGVSAWSATMWWQQSGVMGLKPQPGKPGGLPGTPPAACPGGGTQRRALTSEDRAVIATGLEANWSYRKIGRFIRREASVISREHERNRGPDGSYVGAVAHRAAHEKRRRPKAFSLVENPDLCRRIETWMDQGWSPKLIALMLAEEHPPGSMDRVSHETIYQALYVQTRGHLRADLHKQLSLKRAQRKPRGSRRGGGPSYAEAFTIHQRPAEAKDRAVPGHWEGDLILGTANASAVGTLVERTTRFTILLHLPGRHDAESVAEAMIREMSRLPEHLRRSITWDRGSELAAYERIQLDLATTVFFCDPHSPWQRGTNENTNRLLRFWLEKGSDLSVHDADALKRIADTLNRRPRPTLDLQTPAQRLNELLAKAA
ncbi:MAG TPA: IS30 family transposase [Marmoricola sp.]|nr:IS30 family transposase [Marmoricola sp.]